MTPLHALRRAGAPLSLALLAACVTEDCARDAAPPAGADVTWAAPLDGPVDLLADGLRSEWLFYTAEAGVALADVASFADGVLTIDGDPKGYLATRRWYRDYALEFEWRWADGVAGNSGLLIHATAPLVWHDWPRCIEVQLRADSAGDLILMGDGVGLHANDEPSGRAPSSPGRPDIDRRVAKRVEGLERPPGEWNHLRVECRGDGLTVFVKGMLVNAARDATVAEGAIALQSEGTPIAFRGIRLAPLAAD